MNIGTANIESRNSSKVNKTAYEAMRAASVDGHHYPQAGEGIRPVRYHALARDGLCTHQFFVFVFIIINFSFQLNSCVGVFTVSGLLDNPWSQVSSRLPPGTCLRVLLRRAFRIPTARVTHALLFRLSKKNQKQSCVQQNTPAQIKVISQPPAKMAVCRRPRVKLAYGA